MKESRLGEERELCWDAAVEKKREKYYSIAVVEVVVVVVVAVEVD